VCAACGGRAAGAGQFPHREFDPFPEYVDWFSSQKRLEAFGNPQEPMRRFVPSKHEAKMIMKRVGLPPAACRTPPVARRAPPPR
jgi:hypothetical protein